MRRRIKDVAAARDLSDDDIKAVMSLRHHTIASFTREHRVNVGWLLTGKGRIFENGERSPTSIDQATPDPAA